MANPRFDAALRRMQATHDAKSHDYAREDNPYANFDFAAELAARFTSPMDAVFATMVGIKLARLGELTSGKAPKHESIDDSFLDLANYVVLWWTQRQRLAEPPVPAGDERLMERRTFDDIIAEAGRTSLYTRSTPYGHGV